MARGVVVFLSYARADRERVSRLYDELVGQGLAPWMDARDLLPGEIWEQRIRTIIRDADFFLACLSRHATDKSGFVQAEMKAALRLWEEKPDGSIYVIPVRLEDCLLPQSLSQFHSADVFEPDGVAALVRAIRNGMARRGGTHHVVERPAPPAAMGALSQATPAFEVTLSLLEQYKFEDDVVPRLRDSLRRDFDWDDRLVARAGLFLTEVCANAFVHGGKGDTSSRVTIHVAMENVGQSSERLVMRIGSPGGGFDVAQRLAEEEAREGGEPGGLGLVLARGVVDVFAYSADGTMIQGVLRKNPESGRVAIRRDMDTVEDISIAMFSPRGRIDQAAAERFRAELRLGLAEAFQDTWLDPGSKKGIILDLRDVEYISSAGLRVIMLLWKEIRATTPAARRGPLVIHDPSPLVREILRISKHDMVVPVLDTVDECRRFIRECF